MVAISLSAVLLFMLEPMVGRLVLPVFGGAPAVWTTALAFFTTVVFLGYLYAHVVATRLSARAGGTLHLVLVAGAVAVSAAAPRDVAGLYVAGMPPALNVLLAISVIAGAPAFVLSTTTPLLSAWFARRGGDPWWLYAASNGASLGGLFAYPLVVEPLMGLAAQRWSFLACEVALLGALWAAVAASRRGIETAGARAQARESAEPVPSLRRRLVWLFAALVPAGLLPAVSTYLATDHISAPLLWVWPLGVYLGSFVVAFSARGRRILPVAEKLVPAAVTLMWIPFFARASWPVLLLVPLLLACYAVVAVVIHGRLASDRPAEEHLTLFYLVVSAGGMAATWLVAIVAPIVFNDAYEYPLLLAAGIVALVLLPGAGWKGSGEARANRLAASGVRLAPYLIGGAALVASQAASVSITRFVGVLVFVGALVVIAGASARSLAVGTTVAMLAVGLAFAPSHLARVRTFFGVTEIRSAEKGAAVSEIHGTTLHGLQFKDARSVRPTAYFVRSGPLGDVFSAVDSSHRSGARVAVVGLGIGTIASYGRSGDAITYYEIDPAVMRLARERRYFTYLEDTSATVDVVLGDGRLSLEHAAPHSFDLLVLDAFSSDAVPIHLLTREAIRTYLRVLRPEGLLVFQLTNRHFDLVPAVASTARSLGLETRTRSFTPSDAERERLSAEPSVWLAVGRAGRLSGLPASWVEPPSGPVLTDDYANLLRMLKWR